MRNIPFLDIHSTYNEIKPEIDKAYSRVMESGCYIKGKEVATFEEEFASYCGVKYCVGVGNGLEALHLILKGYGIGPGDEVIVQSNTYIASWLAITHAGAKPVPVEPNPNTFNIDPNRIEKAITKRTRAIMVVHLYGQPTSMQMITEIAKKYGLLIIEDSAQTHGGKYKHQKTGALGDSAGFSFYPTKNLGAFGDAGAVVTNDFKIAENVRMLGNYGSKTKYFNVSKGLNSRLDPLQAAFLSVKLKHLDEWNNRRQTIAEYYLETLKDIPEIELPTIDSEVSHVWHIFAIRIKKRDLMQAFLQENGIGTLIHYPIPPHLSFAFQDLGYVENDFPISEEMAKTELSLPINPHLKKNDLIFIVNKIKALIKLIK